MLLSAILSCLNHHWPHVRQKCRLRLVPRPVGDCSCFKTRRLDYLNPVANSFLYAMRTYVLIFELPLHSFASVNSSMHGLASFVLKESLHGSCFATCTTQVSFYNIRNEVFMCKVETSFIIYLLVFGSTLLRLCSGSTRESHLTKYMTKTCASRHFFQFGARSRLSKFCVVIPGFFSAMDACMNRDWVEACEASRRVSIALLAFRFLQT